MGTHIMLSKIHCDNQIKDGCQDLRRYIEHFLGIRYSHNQSSLEHISRPNKFHSDHIVTHFGIYLSKKMKIQPCVSHFGYVLKDQWQCYTGQCIHY